MEPSQNFSRDAFVGTARYYAEYRPPYPQALIGDLRTKAKITEGARLLDLGCGPGRVALALAPYFSHVWAVDQEKEMVEIGRERAAAVTNVGWIVGRAEELQAPAASFDLVTIGEAFHRFDQGVVARKSFEWLKPGCSIAILWQVNIWQGAEEWQRLVSEVISKYATGRFAIGAHSLRQENPSFEDVLGDNGFTDVETRLFQVPQIWTPDSLIGYLYSTSILAKRVLGDRAISFEAEIRQTLSEYSRIGMYREEAIFGYLLGRKPTIYGDEKSGWP